MLCLGAPAGSAVNEPHMSAHALKGLKAKAASISPFFILVKFKVFERENALLVRGSKVNWHLI